jgi:hypothetical protein
VKVNAGDFYLNSFGKYKILSQPKKKYISGTLPEYILSVPPVPPSTNLPDNGPARLKYFGGEFIQFGVHNCFISYIILDIDNVLT